MKAREVLGGGSSIDAIVLVAASARDDPFVARSCVSGSYEFVLVLQRKITLRTWKVTYMWAKGFQCECAAAKGCWTVASSCLGGQHWN